MTTIMIDDKKKGAKEMMELLQALNFATFFEKKTDNNTKQTRRHNLISFPTNYNPLALAGAAENSPLNLLQIRKEWTKTI